MLAYGWKRVGTKSVATTVATMSEGISDTLDSGPKVLCTGYSIALVAVVQETPVLGMQVDIYGSTLDKESAQNFKKVVNNKLAGVVYSTNGIAVNEGDFGLTHSGEWSSIASVTDVVSANSAEMLGLVAAMSGINGPEMGVTGTAPTGVFGSFGSRDYLSVTGSATAPGFIAIPCSLFTYLQFDAYQPSGSQEATILCNMIA